MGGREKGPLSPFYLLGGGWAHELQTLLLTSNCFSLRPTPGASRSRPYAPRGTEARAPAPRPSGHRSAGPTSSLSPPGLRMVHVRPGLPPSSFLLFESASAPRNQLPC